VPLVAAAEAVAPAGPDTNGPQHALTSGRANRYPAVAEETPESTCALSAAVQFGGAASADGQLLSSTAVTAPPPSAAAISFVGLRKYSFGGDPHFGSLISGDAR
jgi:hypothetical protein